jgi:hypothetical protein
LDFFYENQYAGIFIDAFDSMVNAQLFIKSHYPEFVKKVAKKIIIPPYYILCCINKFTGKAENCFYVSK